MAEFLIKHDLSAVVDFGPSGGDSHHSIGEDVMARIGAFGGLRELLRSLAATPAPSGGGKSLLDLTTLCYNSEFDRGGRLLRRRHKPWLRGERLTRGLRSHSGSKGKIFGATREGSASTLPLLKGQPGSPVPVNETGDLDANGVIYSSKCIFPTLLDIFDCPVPSQQITSWTSVRGVIDASKKIA